MDVTPPTIANTPDSWERIIAIRERKLHVLRTWWPLLTDADWIRIDGQSAILVNVLQDKYGYTQEAAQQEIERCFQALNKIG